MSTPRPLLSALRTAVRVGIATSAPRISASAAFPMTRRVLAGSAPRVPQIVARRAYNTAGAEVPVIFDFDKMQELIKEQPEDYVIVDAREPGELVQSGTIPTAINIPISSASDSFLIHDEDFEDRFGFERPGKDKTLVFFCKAGIRSHAAARLARESGWKTAEYPGSWVDWVAKGGDITHSFN
ncbi:hypothetical protein TD95_001139 [Thielaviopsis punctulata]|uniref:Rhodanese domain-containing protein n=1 Tax=Thielaviopsis punctulata TaxID=72032 RepID=A0A0F4ZA96_9PEZI|nr:hypothetical protein TD95_001139 [Thielaviopsis punctulata]